ncbi:MAG: CHAP domain-containing protein, partial [Actinobacteria bacterium]|nr:CHAP domain-containing protein [Actinomycetota bacterium]
APIVGMAITPDGNGYYLVGANGSIYTFGNAVYYGSLGAYTIGSAQVPAPIVGMAITPDGNGYYLVGANGSIYTFGNAVYYGSLGAYTIGSAQVPAPIVGMAITPDGNGYYLVGANGSIYTFGNAVYYGSLGGIVPDIPVTGMALSSNGAGYWLVDPDGIGSSYSLPGTSPSLSIGSNIVDIASSQIAPATQPGTFCNPYGPCEPWCALFATWVWRSAGVPIPIYSFTGSIYDWGLLNGKVLPPNALPQPGDIVLYGTGPQTVNTSVHAGIVAQVWPGGAIDTIEGDAGPGSNGEYGSVMNGPYYPAWSNWYNGFPVYAFVQP